MVKLIINADDFGYGFLFNKMILELIREKVVTSTSVMVDEIQLEQEEQVKELINLVQRNIASAGLHVYFKNLDFQGEVERQFKKFVDIFGFEPNYLDIHKSDHLEDGYVVIQEFCKDKVIPCKNLRKFAESVKIMPGVITTRDPVFSATGKSLSEIREWLSGLEGRMYAINFHPGYYDPESLSSLNKEREVDAQNARELVQILPEYNIKLANFNDLPRG